MRFKKNTIILMNNIKILKLFFSDTFKTLQTCMAGISGVCEGNAIYDMTKQNLQGLEAICSGTGKCATMINNLGEVGVS